MLWCEWIFICEEFKEILWRRLTGEVVNDDDDDGDDDDGDGDGDDDDDDDDGYCDNIIIIIIMIGIERSGMDLYFIERNDHSNKDNDDADGSTRKGKHLQLL